VKVRPQHNLFSAPRAAGSPFTGPGPNSSVVVLSPDDNYLFVSNQYSDTVTAFSVDPCTGALTLVPGSPFHLPALGPGIHVPSFPSGMATDPAGKFLYVADFYSNKIIGFSIAANGALTSSVPGSPFSNGFPVTGPFPSPPGLLSLAVFPAKTCLVPFVLSVPKLELTASGFQLNGSFTLGQNSNGINPVTETVTLQIGTFSVTIPPCSFQNPHGTFAFQGTINGVSLQVQIVPLANDNFTFKAQGSGVDLTGLTNPVTVVLAIGINSGTTTATAQFQ
jgi:hypothetical protein